MLSTTFTSYFHVVFSLPHHLNSLIRQNEVELYNLLFRTVPDTALELAANPKHLGAKIGFFGILHTWGQNLLFILTSTVSSRPVDSRPDARVGYQGPLDSSYPRKSSRESSVASS